MDSGPITVTIVNATSLAAAVQLPPEWRPIAIVTPAAWTAANLSFQVSHDGGTTFNDFYDDGGNEVLVTASASRFIALPPRIFAGVTNIKVRSGTSAVPVNQGGTRTLVLVGRGY